MELFYIFIILLTVLVIFVLLLSYIKGSPNSSYASFGKLMVVIVIGAMLFSRQYSIAFALLGAVILWLIIDFIDRRYGGW